MRHGIEMKLCCAIVQRVRLQQHRKSTLPMGLCQVHKPSSGHAKTDLKDLV